MATVYYVADGPRDRATLPPLVETVLSVEHDVEFAAWKSIKLHKGYGRKLKYAARRALNRGDTALIAVVDRDTGDPRLPKLADQRDADRGLGLPTAVGEANPYVDVWLIDDLQALRDVLGMDPTAKAPPGKNPKAELDALIHESDIDGLMPALEAVAGAVRIERCRRAKETGFNAFVEDLLAELPSLRG